MKENYHTHTSRCHHAYGTEEEYILKAIERGVRTLGFSDHSTYLFPSSFVSTHRMLPFEIEDYVNTLRVLREKYKDKIDIRIGFEVEYYPELWEESLNSWREWGIEYLILGQHYVGKEYEGAPSAGGASDSVDKLVEYVDLVLAAIDTGSITYVAHPDLINFTGDGEIYDREMMRLIGHCRDTGTPLEINLLGVRTGRNYPSDAFWRLVAATDAKVVIGCDAHESESVANPDDLCRAEEYIDRLGLRKNLVEHIELIKP